MRAVVTRKVNQHQVLRKLFMVGTHLQLDTAVKVAVKRTVRTTTARASAGNRVDLNLAAGGIVFQRAFREAPNSVKSLSCMKNMYGLGLLFFST